VVAFGLDDFFLALAQKQFPDLNTKKMNFEVGE